ncbi:MAG: UDP-3-O-acyl-N-acetylglucosamine deacetylase [Alphaproteobacteria bacterium]|nr:UDP-3-O-acyl-N-acetylglucosamine deacetylase [Alphaproteobacteria bacterium]
MREQRTIAGPAMCAGIGVHTGARMRLVVSPAPADAGVVFVRTDLSGDNRIEAHAAFVTDTVLGTTLENGAGASIATVEHLLSACSGLGLDNLLIEIDGPEVPILDGSAGPFVRLLEQAGAKTLPAPRRVIRILEPIVVEEGAKRAALLPDPQSETLTLDVTIRFTDPAIGVQRRVARLTREDFLSDIADARTFGFMADVERLRAHGRGLGASLDNAVVVENGRVVNPEGLRFEDEFVRHKMLDAIGDLALAGGRIAGRFEADQPGHAMNARLIREVLRARNAWCWESLGQPVYAAAGA